MAVLRKHYDRSKHELKSKKDRLAQLERDLDNLHSRNLKDGVVKNETLISSPTV